MNSMLRLVVVMIAYAQSCSMALADELPTDADLKSAYCITVFQNHLDSIQSVIAQGQIGLADDSVTPEQKSAIREAIKKSTNILPDYERKLARIQSYLLPRTNRLASGGLLAASDAAKKDLADDLSIKLECSRTSNGNVEKAMSCISASVVWQRIQSCDALSYLPY